MECRGAWGDLTGIGQYRTYRREKGNETHLGERFFDRGVSEIHPGVLAACCTCGFFAYTCKKSRLMGMLSEFVRYKYLYYIYVRKRNKLLVNRELVALDTR
jgi:hypothetical protein